MSKKIEIYSADDLNHVDLESLEKKIFPRGIPEISNWSERRKKEFLLSRNLVWKLFKSEDINLESNDLYIDNRQCIWPAGYFGSISHTLHTNNESLIIAGVISKSLSPGIDVEYTERFSKKDISKTIMMNSEHSIFKASFGDQATSNAVCFCAKESIFKSLYPICKTFFGFRDAQVVDIQSSQNGWMIKTKILISLPKIKNLIISTRIVFHNDFIEAITFYK